MAGRVLAWFIRATSEEEKQTTTCHLFLKKNCYLGISRESFLSRVDLHLLGDTREGRKEVSPGYLGLWKPHALNRDRLESKKVLLFRCFFPVLSTP